GGVHADMALVMVGHNDTPWIRPDGSLRRNLAAILDLIHARDVRVANFYDDGRGDPGVVAEYARAICEVARRHGARCADVSHVFPGDSAGASLCRPIIRPAKKAPMSPAQTASSTANVASRPWSEPSRSNSMCARQSPIQAVPSTVAAIATVADCRV